MKQSSKIVGNVVFTVSDAAGRLISRKHVPFVDGELAIEALRKAAEIRTKETNFGEQIISIDGVKSQWFHFFIKRKENDREGMPFIALSNGKRAYLDLRHMALSPTLDGIEISIKVVSCCSDLPNSVTDGLSGCFSDFSLHEIERVQTRLGKIISRSIEHELWRAPNFLLQQLLLQSRMPQRRLRDLYVEKMLSSALRHGLISYSDGSQTVSGNALDDADETELSFTFKLSPPQAVGNPPTLILGRTMRSYSAAGQRKKERAKLKELGPRATARDRESVEALQEELYKRQQQVEPLLVANLDRVRSSLDCPVAS